MTGTNYFIISTATVEIISACHYLFRACHYLFLIFLLGCQTAPPKSAAAEKAESSKEVVSALGAVTEGLTNQDLSEKDLRNLAASAQKDPQTRSALQSVNQALGARQAGVKYCPQDGERFSADLLECPTHHVKLKDLD